MAFARIPDSKQISSKIGSTNVIYLIIALLGYTISYILKIKIGIGGNLHDVFTCIGSVALGIFSYQAVSYLKIEKFKKALNAIGKVAFIIYLMHAPPIQYIIRPILKKFYSNDQGILMVCMLLAAYLVFIILISAGLAKHFKGLSIKIENNMERA
jgi:hypothetical protein